MGQSLLQYAGFPSAAPEAPERSAFPGPQCEDPRGSVWTTVSGDYGFYPDLDPGDFEGESSFAIRIPRDGAFTHRGTAEYQVCPRQDYATASGAPIDTTAKRCSKITIEIQ